MLQKEEANWAFPACQGVHVPTTTPSVGMVFVCVKLISTNCKTSAVSKVRKPIGATVNAIFSDSRHLIKWRPPDN